MLDIPVLPTGPVTTYYNSPINISVGNVEVNFQGNFVTARIYDLYTILSVVCQVGNGPVAEAYLQINCVDRLINRGYPP